jgi:predicted transcriptional regulator
MKKTIDNFMTVSEAAERWGVPADTIRNYLKPSNKKKWQKTEKMIELGLLKYHQSKFDTKKEWILSKDAMEVWFGVEKKEAESDSE